LNVSAHPERAGRQSVVGTAAVGLHEGRDSENRSIRAQAA
jgi:hypothetical protein